jgi:GTP-binding protein HflX
LNTLTGADVLVRDMLFATLDTRTRRWQLPGWGPVLLSDTVGFIRDLPHHLIASFKATLEEARQADLLLHVADAANRAVFDQIASVYRVFQELQIEHKDSLLVLNKCDKVADASQVDSIMRRYPHAIPVSARTGRGLDDLAAAVSEALSRGFLDLDVEADVGNGRLLAYLAAHGEVLSRQYTDRQVVVHCRIPAEHLHALRSWGAAVRPHCNGQPAAAASSEDLPK